MDQQRLKAELESKRTEGAVLKRLGGLRGIASMLTGTGVPREVRTIVEEVLTADHFKRYHVLAERHAEIGAAFVNLSDDDVHRTIETLLPQIAPSVESAWKALALKPYQEGPARKPFRSPRAPMTLAGVRGRWLLQIIKLFGDYDADIRWLAEHAAYLSLWTGGIEIGWLLAGAIDLGGETGQAVYDILTASASGEHETGEMGHHVPRALLSCGRSDAWEFVERLLLAAQRQEGLRQSILAAVDESHPQAFRRMLRLIHDENLARFSSVVRAADVWFGFQWDGASAVKVDSIIERVLRFLDDDSARTTALTDEDPETVYLALWSRAFDDVDAAIPSAIPLLASDSAPIRFVATHLLVQSLMKTAIPPLVDVLGDADLNVVCRALDVFGTDMTKVVDGPRLFERLEQLMARLPKRSQELTSPVWPWWNRKLEKSHVASAMTANASAVAAERLLPYVPELQPAHRAEFVRQMSGVPRRRGQKQDGERKTSFSPTERTILLELMGDASGDVRAAVFEALRGLPVMPDELERLIELLDRKPGDLRNGCLTRLRQLGDQDLLAAADRLLADSSEPRRVAGLELLRDASEAGRMVDEVRTRVERYAKDAPAVAAEERGHVAAVLSERTDKATTDDALGLVDPATLRQWPEPRTRHIELDTPGSRASLTSLAELVLEHQATEVPVATGETKLLVEAGSWRFGPRKVADAENMPAAFPLATVWRSWLEARPPGMRDDDGLELIRAIVVDHESPAWKSPPVQQVIGLAQWGAGQRFLAFLLEWCAVWEPPRTTMPFLLDGFERSLAAITDKELKLLDEHASGDRSPFGLFSLDRTDPRYALREKINAAHAWLRRIRWWKEVFPGTLDRERIERLYGLVRGFDRRSNGVTTVKVTLDDFVTAYRHGIVDSSELIDLALGKLSMRWQLLREVSTRKPPRALAEHPELLAVVDRCRRRVVEVESQRGDRETAASRLALELRATGGLDTLSLALPSLGKSHFARHFGWLSTGASRQETLSHLVLRSVPRESDTRDAFARWARESKVSQSRLVELALYAPQWAGHVNHVLGWPGLESAVWWIQAHTKDDRSWQLHELKEIWAAEVSEHTPLSAADLTEGAVDVAWFHESHTTLGAERWTILDKAAKYAASSAGHTRAQLFSRAMSGLTSASEILDRMKNARHQDSVRALGLVPLATGDDRQRDLLARYQALQEFHREARQFGSQRQQSERRAVAIGLSNLARTAGFRDPQRLQWAMEQAAVADLARGPVVLQRGDVSLALSIDGDGSASLEVTKNGKPLKAIPASLKKDAEVEELKDRLQELKRQRSRVRDALENAMCRGDRFLGSELRALFEHPVLAPSVSKLVFLGDGVAGYPAERGRALRDHAGGLHVLGNDEEVRIAHPHDLFVRGDWSAWQRECFAAERVQPFKQLFRELYPITETEREIVSSHRYAGHQVNPRQALALLGTRGWVARPDEGVSRTFHEAGLTVRLSFQETFMTPAEVEGLTLEDVIFTKKGEWIQLPLSTIPPLVFSEALRDVDLVVSVAHRGGVDPEATASTVEMRAALVRETTALLDLGNVEMLPNHAIVRGTLGTYSVHLGSGNVMLMPGTAIPIVAVHSQHRGRLFLPFADDDPRTAEVISKVLLLARDKEIRDPHILEWIRAAQGGPAN
jgi:uncharacterized protein DUF5724/uncharacterized protein DUF4132